LRAGGARDSVALASLAEPPMKNFALIGAAGYVAPRHLEAIRATGNQLVVAVDPHDSVGILDRYFPNARFFTEVERFDRHLEKLRRRGPDDAVHYVSICSPNYLHDAHCRLALRVGADAICEKPLVINPWNLDQLAELEADTGHTVWTVLQLRVHPLLVALREKLLAAPPREKAKVDLGYITRRGSWYHYSWKGDVERSGGLAMNIGVHFFDLLVWLFGGVESTETHLAQGDRMAGAIELERASVRWFLSVNSDDLPEATRAAGRPAWRSLTIDGEEIEVSDVFSDLHNRVYEAILAGNGYRSADARQAIELVHRIRHAEVVSGGDRAHPLLARG
jgi:UDP-N-acetyl-2-amino-2-deoxyglucuronate dehydrogenase